MQFLRLTIELSGITVYNLQQKNAEGVTFDDWREMKRSEKQKQQRITEAQRQEMEDGYSTSHRNECNKAFRE